MEPRVPISEVGNREQHHLLETTAHFASYRVGKTRVIQYVDEAQAIGQGIGTPVRAQMQPQRVVEGERRAVDVLFLKCFRGQLVEKPRRLGFSVLAVQHARQAECRLRRNTSGIAIKSSGNDEFTASKIELTGQHRHAGFEQVLLVRRRMRHLDSGACERETRYGGCPGGGSGDSIEQSSQHDREHEWPRGICLKYRRGRAGCVQIRDDV